MEELQSYPEYPVFKGLQRPLEAFGFQGRYITWAACTLGGGILIFFVGYLVFGVLVAFLSLLAVLGVGALFIFLRQSKGLHSKNTEKGIFITKHTCYSELRS